MIKAVILSHLTVRVEIVAEAVLINSTISRALPLKNTLSPFSSFPRKPILLARTPRAVATHHRMGRNSRKRKQHNSLVRNWRQDAEEEQQARSLDSQHSRELRFSCVLQGRGESLDSVCTKLRCFCQRWGGVVDVEARHRRSKGANRSSSSSSSPPPDLIVEMATPAAAQGILQNRTQVLLYDRQQGRATQQLALAAPSNVGYLRSSACFSCRGRPSAQCSCQRYCK